MEYKVDFNYIKKLQPVNMGGDNLLNFIRASILLIKLLNRLFCVQISYIQPDKVANLVSQCQGLFLIYYSFIDRLGPYHFVNKELLQFFHLFYKSICFCDLHGLINRVRGVIQGFKTYLRVLAVVSQKQRDFYSF